MHHYFFIDETFTATLIAAANREAANAKFKSMHPDNEIKISMPAVRCQNCNKFKTPAGFDSNGSVGVKQYRNVEICNEAQHEPSALAMSQTPLS